MIIKRQGHETTLAFLHAFSFYFFEEEEERLVWELEQIVLSFTLK